MRNATLDMDRPSRGRSLPALLMGLMLVLAAVPVAMLGSPRTAGDPAPAVTTRSPAVVMGQRDIRFEDYPDGTAIVRDATNASEVLRMTSTEGGFVRSFLRLLAVERRRFDAPQTTPFRVTHWSSGSVTVEDPALGRTIEIKAFGATNAEAIARLTDDRRTTP